MDNVSIQEPFTLPCGLVVPNRLCKAALAEDLATGSGEPSARLNALYETWAQGKYGMILTGNFMADGKQCCDPHDVFAPTGNPTAAKLESTVQQWRAFASTIQAAGTPGIVQIGHPGRQSLRALRRGASLAPSRVPLRLGPTVVKRVSSWLLFGRPKEASLADIAHVIDRFTETARLVAEAGFAGCQIHAAHGYLLSTFLSAKVNQRTDEYGGTPAKRARIVREIVDAVRAVVPPGFAVGLKINSADNVQDAQGLADALEQLKVIVGDGGVDFIEISGGSYENLSMLGNEYAAKKPGDAPRSDRTAAREAFFLDFAESMRAHFPSLCLMVTGGFRTRDGMNEALRTNACDLIGLGRPTVTTPKLPVDILFNDKIADKDAVAPVSELHVPTLARVLTKAVMNEGLVTYSFKIDMKDVAEEALATKKSNKRYK